MKGIRADGDHKEVEWETRKRVEVKIGEVELTRGGHGGLPNKLVISSWRGEIPHG